MTAVDWAVRVQVLVDVLVKCGDQESWGRVGSRGRLLHAVGLTPLHVRKAAGRAQWCSVRSFEMIPHV